VLQPAERIAAGELKCPRCGGESVPRFLHTLAKHSEFLDLPIDELGLPPADIVWARCGEQSLGMQLPATACGTAPPPLI
jgi:hypothetical protein